MKSGCENCRKTERNLAGAYIQVTALITAERDLSLAEQYAREASATVNDRREDLRNLRKTVALWLEEQR